MWWTKKRERHQDLRNKGTKKARLSRDYIMSIGATWTRIYTSSYLSSLFLFDGCWASGQVSSPDEKKNWATADEELSPITTQSLVLRALPSAPLACYTTQGRRGSIHFPSFFLYFLKDPISFFWRVALHHHIPPDSLALECSSLWSLFGWTFTWLEWYAGTLKVRTKGKAAAGCVPPFWFDV